MTEKSAMQDLFQRLRKIGFDPDFLRRAVLPDWWEDSLASVAANRALQGGFARSTTGLRAVEKEQKY